MVSVSFLSKAIAAFVIACAAQMHAQDANTTLVIDERAALSEGFLGCAAAPASPGDRRKDKSQLKYATYNVEFLFLQGLGQLDCPGTGCKWKDVDMAERHIKQIAANIRVLDADILQLNEVEDCSALNAVVHELNALGDNTYKPYLIQGKDSATGQNSALLTRVDPSVDLQRSDASVQLPAPNSKCPGSRASGSKSLSKHFYTTFNVAGFAKPLTIVSAHLLAFPQDKKRCFEREAQATIVSQIAQAALNKGNHVIISGDMNDFAADVPDRNNNKPISNVLGIMTGTSFVNAAANVPQPTRYTQWWDKNRDCVYELTEVSSLDHVLVSKSLSARVNNVVFGNEIFAQSCESFNSDHFPIVVTLQAEV
ncbi:TPA: hypothetical protein N0F65_012957 [Lagenidium giganteum]|uniref:Endonuclease/exonuclease/phosphatase domain-containing protein n=1 Tax=Lagenidium giganteum TaxID=4803 RepID=A0AAV2Z1Z9_9STRA|nr:TPA: hypothetical protein N0F65_012957 [Lagenidium giganteum]